MVTVAKVQTPALVHADLLQVSMGVLWLKARLCTIDIHATKGSSKWGKEEKLGVFQSFRNVLAI